MGIKRGLLWLAAIGILLLSAPVDADVREEIRSGVAAAVEAADVSAWDSVLARLPEEARAFWGDKSAAQLVGEYAAGTAPYLGESLLFGVLERMKALLPDFLGVLLRFVVIALISGFVNAMGEAGVNGLRDIAGFASQAAAIVVVLGVYLPLLDTANNAVTQTSEFIELCFPALLTLLTATGSVGAAGVFQPAMAMLTGGVALVLQRAVLPLILAGSVLALLNNITGRVQLKHLSGLTKSAAKWTMGMLFTLYFGITSLQGMTASAFDSVTVRTAKYAADKMIPIVGGAVSGMVDTVLGCSVLVKNAAGAAAILIAFAIVCEPLLKILAGVFAFRIAAAVTEPVADARLPQMMTALSDMLTYLFAVTLVLALLFVLTIGLMMSAGAGAAG